MRRFLPSPVTRRFDAVICDIDGCLSPESSAPMDAGRLAEVAAWNLAAQRDGDRPVVTLCSGRPQPFAEAMCRLIGNRTLPVVAENGVWLYFPDRNVYERDPAIGPEHLAAVHEARRWVEKDLGPRGVVMQPGKEASISLYHADTEYLKSLEAPVRAAFAERGWPLRVSMTWLYINCDLEHVSKGTGLDRLMGATALRRERLAGIGDTMGDLPIRERTAFFACPANADERLRARADLVASRGEAEGVLEVLRALR
jgi:hydroxymethylpyrimidine pyrophosphatase-like HAD family hydrolase